MPAPHRTLTTELVGTHVRDHVFDVVARPGAEEPGAPRHAPRHGVGIELEWLTAHREGFARLTLEQAGALLADLTPLPGGSRLSVEPGGQLELSSVRFTSVSAALGAVATDLFVVDQACAQRGIDLVALGADPVRQPERIVTAPRYAAMQAYFDAQGADGRTMMCNTAAIQLNVGLGAPGEVARRWRLANAVGPTLIASFANSPFAEGRPTGWQSTRLRSWWALDPTRSAPVPLTADPVAAFVDYALDAKVMLVRAGRDDYRPITSGLTLRGWLAQGHELGWPTIEDLDYHLTTLFPPVRPRGWFEIRYFDALPTPFWHVAVAVTCALLDDPEAAEAAERAIGDSAGLWRAAAQHGVAHPALGASSRACFELALAALERHATTSAEAATTEAVAAYHDRWVARGRSPADDRLDEWHRHDTLVPERESPVPYGADLLAGVDPP